jgi:hypothetical protein
MDLKEECSVGLYRMAKFDFNFPSKLWNLKMCYFEINRR